MAPLQADVVTTVIAVWLGHAGVRSTDDYVVCQKLHQTGEPNGLLRQLQG